MKTTAPQIPTLAVAQFLRVRLKRGYGLWGEDELVRYLGHHHHHGSLGVVAGLDGRITAVGVAYRLKRETTRRTDFTARTWKYHTPEPDGPMLYIDLLVSVWPRAVAALVAELQWRHPDWRRLQLCSVRRGKLRHYGNVEKFLSRCENL